MLVLGFTYALRFTVRTHLRAKERHLPYVISQVRPVLTLARQASTQLPTPEGWKAELTLVVGYIPK